MTVISDLKKATAAAMVAKGTYMTAAESTEDVSAKSHYEEMVNELDKHIQFLNGRITYLDENIIL